MTFLMFHDFGAMQWCGNVDMQAMLMLQAATMRRLQPSAWTLGVQFHEMETSRTNAGGSRKRQSNLNPLT